MLICLRASRLVFTLGLLKGISIISLLLIAISPGIAFVSERFLTSSYCSPCTESEKNVTKILIKEITR